MRRGFVGPRIERAAQTIELVSLENDVAYVQECGGDSTPFMLMSKDCGRSLRSRLSSGESVDMLAFSAAWPQTSA